MGQVILQALGNLFTVQNLIFANIGIFIGIIFGAIPGMNETLRSLCCFRLRSRWIRYRHFYCLRPFSLELTSVDLSARS